MKLSKQRRTKDLIISLAGKLRMSSFSGGCCSLKPNNNPICNTNSLIVELTSEWSAFNNHLIYNPWLTTRQQPSENEAFIPSIILLFVIPAEETISRRDRTEPRPRRLKEASKKPYARRSVKSWMPAIMKVLSYNDGFVQS